MREVPSCWSEVYLPLQQPFLQQDQLSGPHIWTVWRLLPAKSSHHSVRVAHHQLTAPITVYRTDMHTMRSNSQDQYTRWTSSSEKAKWGFTDITDQDDFGVGRDVLGEKRLLVFRGCEFMLTGWIWFTRCGSCQVKEVKPALGSNSDHKVLSNGTKTYTLYHQNFPDSLLQIINHFITHPSFVADVSDCDAGQLGKQQIARWVRETISLWNHKCFQVSVLTMPTQVLVIQGLESSFLYTCSFPLVSPTTSSFNCSLMETDSKLTFI